MRRWMAISGLLVLLLTLLMVVGVALARTRPNPMIAMGFGLCDGVPCYQGLVPGTTLWLDALKALNIKGQTESMIVPKDYGVFHIDLATIDEHVVSSKRKMTYLSLKDVEPQQALPTLGDLILFYGTPCGYRIFINGPNEIIFEMRDFSFLIYTTDGRIRPDLHVTGILLYRDPALCDARLPKWMGFRSLRHYQDTLEVLSR